jgi:hypothetical protein
MTRSRLRAVGNMGGAALRELASRALNNEETAKAVREFFESGAECVVSEIDGLAAVGAGDFVARYQLSDGMKRLVAAARARDGITDDLVQPIA